MYVYYTYVLRIYTLVKYEPHVLLLTLEKGDFEDLADSPQAADVGVEESKNILLSWSN
jgi:hypothetical protein